MAESSFIATGELYLKKITPVIDALFGGFNLSSYPDIKGRVSFDDDDFSPGWIDVRNALVAKVLVPIMTDPDGQVSEDCMQSVLYVLADQFEQAQNCALMNFIENASFDPDEKVSMASLYFLATSFDDNHGLRAMHFQGSWSSNKPRMGALGGCCSLESGKFSFTSDCHHDLTWAIGFDEQLYKESYHDAAHLLVNRVCDAAAGVIDPKERNAIILSVALQLLACADKDAIVPLDTVHLLWESLSNVAINDDCLLEVPFLFFPVGTNVEDVWHWFERMNSQFSVAQAMLGQHCATQPPAA